MPETRACKTGGIRSAAARSSLVVPLLAAPEMGCGASAPTNSASDVPAEKASRAVTERVAEEKMMTSNTLQAIDHTLPAEPAPKVALPPPMPPPADFSTFAGSTAKLSKQAIEALLIAIGCRKGVLRLAMSAFDDAGLDTAGVELASWWGALNARSRIVIESKLRGCNSGVIFAVAHACGTLTAGEPASSASSADLRESLDHVGVSEEKTSAMLSGVDDAVRPAFPKVIYPHLSAPTSTLIYRLRSLSPAAHRWSSSTGSLG